MTHQVVTKSPQQRHAAASGSKLRILGGAVVLTALLAIGTMPRVFRNREALAATNESQITHPLVSILHPRKGQATSELLLPGNVEPLYSAAIYARTDGYLQKRFVDIGSKVKAGELVAVIASPEVDQQLQQARSTLAQSIGALQQAKAALQQAKANQELARLTKERDLPLGEQHAISQQIVDEAVQAFDARAADVSAANANIVASEANVTANQANVARLLQLQSFERIVAPFEGVITARNVEQGDLITTGSAGQGRALFNIAQSGTLRIQVDVPQSQAVNIQDGQTAMLSVKERLGREYTGTVVRNANSLDSAARTMRAEVQLDNRDGSLLPGMYADVKFTLAEPRTSLIVPTSSLVIEPNGMHVVAVQSGNKLRFLPVVLGKDLGTDVEILSGIRPEDAIVSSPGDLLHDGQTVQVR